MRTFARVGTSVENELRFVKVSEETGCRGKCNFKKPPKNFDRDRRNRTANETPPRPDNTTDEVTYLKNTLAHLVKHDIATGTRCGVIKYVNLCHRGEEPNGTFFTNRRRKKK